MMLDFDDDYFLEEDKLYVSSYTRIVVYPTLPY